MAPAAVVQLIVIILGCGLTIATVVYKAGKIEGRVVTKLEDHDRRLLLLEGDRRTYDRRAEDHP